MSFPSFPEEPKGISEPAVLDALAVDQHRDSLVLLMIERRSWTLGLAQLRQLQEKLNAYASFILDGELARAFPEHRGKRVEIQLRSQYPLSDEAAAMVNHAREQFHPAGIFIEVIEEASLS